MVPSHYSALPMQVRAKLLFCLPHICCLVLVLPFSTLSAFHAQTTLPDCGLHIVDREREGQVVCATG